jgi:ribonuclease BN (tRNA processing enzyme)
MKQTLSLFLWCVFLLLCWGVPSAHAAPTCGTSGLAVQVLGSGGPQVQGKRASSSYLIWLDGKARVLIDSGGGSALRFGESEADFMDLDVVLFTHLHVDHSADFPALVKSSFFQKRSAPLPVYGPPGNEHFPATTAFVKALFEDPKGAYAYLSAFVDPKGESSYKIQAHDVVLKPDEAQKVFANERLRVTAMQVLHGPVPAVAYRIDIGAKSVVFSSDNNGDNGNLEKLAKQAHLLVAHHAAPEGASGVERKLHMPPSVIGRIAAEANVKSLVLSHRMVRTLGREAESQAAIAAAYHGPINFANDLSCFELR